MLEEVACGPGEGCLIQALLRQFDFYFVCGTNRCVTTTG